MTKDAQSMRQGLLPSLTLTGSYAALEPMSLDHVGELGKAACDGELWALHVTSVPKANDGLEDVLAYVKKALVTRDLGEALPFVVRRLSDNSIVGSTRYYRISCANRNLSIGYTWYAKSAQKTAINTECKLMLLKHAFEVLGCISVQWHTHHENYASQAAIERLGAVKEGVLRNHVIMPDGSFRHTHCYSLLDTEWPASQAFLTERLNRS